jgi:hypothetical protein
MALDFNGTTQYLSRTSAVVTGYPVTMACWANVDNLTARHGLMQLRRSADGFSDIVLVADGASADKILAAVEVPPEGYDAATTAAFTANTWFHAAGVFASDTSRSAFLNGGSKGTDTMSLVLETLNATQIGQWNYNDGVQLNYTNGRIAEAAIWNVALTDAEVSLLALGYSPLFVRPGSLVSYWPIIGRYSPEIDVVGGLGLTLNAAPAVAEHCRIFYPKRKTAFLPGAVVSSRLPRPMMVNQAVKHASFY